MNSLRGQNGEYPLNSLSRSLLFVPGSAPERIVKAQGLSADGLILDLEDAVATTAKDTARVAAMKALADWPTDNRQYRVVRINGTDTPYHADDMRSVLLSNAQAIMLPKCETAEQVAGVANAVKTAGKRLIALVETAKGVLNVGAIAASHPAISMLCFGHADFARDMELDDNDAAAGVILHARAQVSLAARAAGITAIDNVSLAIRDPEAFTADASLGRQLGYQGKMCIHPAQLDISNTVFSPSDAQIAYARKVSAAWDEAQKQGIGVFSLDNKMIDAPVIDAQLRILERARLTGQLPG